MTPTTEIPGGGLCHSRGCTHRRPGAPVNGLQAARREVLARRVYNSGGSCAAQAPNQSRHGGQSVSLSVHPGNDRATPPLRLRAGGGFLRGSQ